MLADRSHPRHLLPVLFAFAGCVNPVDTFTQGRALDPCSGSNYGVCNTVAGCILDNSNYIQGHFPGQELVLVTTPGPATVRLHFLLQSVTSSGQQTLLTWYEPGCTNRFQLPVIGTVFVGEAQTTGEFVREYAVGSQGDHEITYQSDANADYYFKIEVIPK